MTQQFKHTDFLVLARKGCSKRSAAVALLSWSGSKQLCVHTTSIELLLTLDGSTLESLTHNKHTQTLLDMAG